MRLIRVTQTDHRGWFDFGFVPPGHYTLIVNDRKWDRFEWFDVEVRADAAPMSAVLIDISPHFPDCKGGHEFVVYGANERPGRMALGFAFIFIASGAAALVVIWAKRPVKINARSLTESHPKERRTSR